MWNGRIKGLFEGLDIEIYLYVFRVGSLLWCKQRLSINYGFWVERRLTTCR